MPALKYEDICIFFLKQYVITICKSRPGLKTVYFMICETDKS